MLASLDRLKLLAGVGPQDNSQDAVLALALAASDAAIKAFCKRRLEQEVLTEYQDGNGISDLVLRQRPVQAYQLTGSVASGAAIVTGLSSTANLIVGMPATHADLPRTATISTIDSSTQVTLSEAATAAISADRITFGIALWLSAGGFYGDAVDAYPNEGFLRLGIDYALLRDQPDGSSRAGILRRLGSGNTGAYLDWPWDWRKGTLTARMPPGWPAGYGNLKVIYTAGYATIPDDLQQACVQLALWLWMYGPRAGLVVGQEAKEDYSYALTVLRQEPDLGSTRQILARYREVSI